MAKAGPVDPAFFIISESRNPPIVRPFTSLLQAAFGSPYSTVPQVKTSISAHPMRSLSTPTLRKFVRPSKKTQMITQKRDLAGSRSSAGHTKNRSGNPASPEKTGKIIGAAKFFGLFPRRKAVSSCKCKGYTPHEISIKNLLKFCKKISLTGI